MPEVKIIGAGMAGMSAALRLAERGYEVDLYEQDSFCGGMLRAYHDDITNTRREHSYHMFMNWYHNFWQIADELGIMDNFSPREGFRFLRKGHFDDMPILINPGGPQDMMRNLASGAASPADLFVFMYSMVDLLATPIHRDDFLDHYSVNAYMKSRPYMTEDCAELHQKIWFTVWSIASYQASAKSYREFLKYGNRVPVPQLWVLNGDKHTTVIEPWHRRLDEHDHFHFRPLHRLREIVPTADGRRVERLVFDVVDCSPSVNPRPHEPGSGIGDGAGWSVIEEHIVEVGDSDVIVSVTPGMMAQLVEGDLYNADQKLGGIRYLESEPMGSLELHLNRKLPNVPADVTVFMDAKYQMTFLDYSQMWPDQKNTFLYVTISDVIGLLSVPAEQRDDDGCLILDVERPRTAIDYVLREVLANVPITIDDINLQHTSIELNTGEELFANLTGSWDHRPTTRTRLENLFLAGTYVRNFADVSTIEGAVATGLMAAEAVRSRRGVGTPIEVIEPDAYPVELFQALKVAWAPYVYAAKALSDSGAAIGLDGADFLRRLGIDRMWSAWPEAGRAGAFFWDFLPSSAWTDAWRDGLGPLMNYWPDGTARSAGRRR